MSAVKQCYRCGVEIEVSQENPDWRWTEGDKPNSVAYFCSERCLDGKAREIRNGARGEE